MKNSTVLIVILIITLSCSDRKKEDSRKVTVSVLVKILEFPKSSNLFAEQEYVTLESTERCLWGDIDEFSNPVIFIAKLNDKRKN